MTLKFGTDGVRGVANVDLTPELATALGRAGARVLGGSRWAVGHDTRRSSPMLDAAFSAGLASQGVDVEALGVAPTPMVAWWAATRGAPAAVVSASHNPFPDNGIKMFSSGGRKLSEDVERQIEEELAAELATERERRREPGKAAVSDVPAGSAVGTIEPVALDTGYAASVISSIEGRRLDGLHLAVDCANGAASFVAPEVFRELGASVTVFNCEPDGTNINRDCGSTHPAALRDAVAATGADVGVAFDGDADRVILTAVDGDLIDGDQIIAICAIDLLDRGALAGNAVVVTVMTNLGFRLAMAERGVRIIETPVGDRYVLEALEEGGYTLGGEQSGHVIFRGRATTGDGLLTAVQVLDVVVRSGQPLAALAEQAMTKVPQVLRSVRVPGHDPAATGRLVDGIAAEIAGVEFELGERGRVLVRPSGTEPVIRVMVEAPTEQLAGTAADRLVAALHAAV
jgi:phosphoglucosamine mutase